ncbi:hypothetical protein DS831_03090 [Bombilactobacillus bombi]|uniref:isochorismate synthase n=1 Tax=Bombilactobacillus bombi TaxID=1303590 RepID=A0A417ZK48_9LACO|nr:isochorismate synthase [Bombilactobacillus bombi]RHW52325.1 hypothetical protein DS831_03090 [Bombilactobacillus bombi]
MSAALFIKTKTIDSLNLPQAMAWLQHQAGPNFAWENPTQDHLLIASGQILEVSLQQAVNFNDLNNLLQQAQQQLGDLSAKELSHLKVVGGFPFNIHQLGAEVWQNLKGGRLWIPHILIERRQNTNYLTLIESNPHQINSHWNKVFHQIQTTSPLKAQRYSLTDVQELALLQYQNSLKIALQKIATGSLKKVVVGRFAVGNLTAVQPAAVWLQLRDSQPDVYHILIQDQQTAFLSATPERLLATKKQHFQTAAVAGTIRRDSNPIIDQQLQQDLLHDYKNLQEQDLVVQWIKTALQKLHLQVSAPMTPQIIQTATVQHLYTSIQADGFANPAQVLAQLHPTPALGGLPKAAALNFLKNHESESRGMFGAPIGYLDANNQGEFAVGIRSCLLTPDQIRLFAGSGIINGSEINIETQETHNKLQAMLSAFQIEDR